MVRRYIVKQKVSFLTISSVSTFVVRRLQSTCCSLEFRLLQLVFSESSNSHLGLKMSSFERTSERKAERHSSGDSHHVNFHDAMGKDGGRACLQKEHQATQESGKHSLQRCGFSDGDHLLESCRAAEASATAMAKPHEPNHLKETSGSSNTEQHNQAGGGENTKPRVLTHFNFEGNKCETQPMANEVPNFTQNDAGCNYTSDPEAVKAFNKADPSTMRLHQYGTNDAGEGMIGSGTGTAVGKEGDVCKVLTSDHVVRNEQIKNSERIDVIGGNGRYSATPAYENKLGDKSILNVKMGNNIDQDCHPAEVAEGQPARGDKYSTVSYPHGSWDSYISQGKIGPTIETPDQGTLTATEGPHASGMSGAGVRNEQGQVIGVHHSGYDQTGFYSPVDRKNVDYMLAHPDTKE
jgi:hypothetical protein